MLGVASGAVLVPLNSTMLAVALPSVMDEFGDRRRTTVSSLVTLYLGAVTVALPASGSLGDRFGQRRVFLVGVVAFALASLLAAAAHVLRAARAAARPPGASAARWSRRPRSPWSAAMSPPERRGAAFGLFDMLVSTSAAIGPFIGGVLVGAFGWRSLFVIAVPVALVRGGRWSGWSCARIGRRRARRPAAPRPKPIDVAGSGPAGRRADRPPRRDPGGGRAAGSGSVAALAVLPLLVLFVRFELRERPPGRRPAAVHGAAVRRGRARACSARR